MFCCYFLSVFYQWITDELFIDKCLDEYENMIEMHPIVRAASTQQLEATVVSMVTAIVTNDVTDETCNDPLLQQMVQSPPSIPHTTRLRKQIHTTEEELYTEDFEIIEMGMFESENQKEQ